MSQVRFGNCVNVLAPQPNLAPPDYPGRYTVMEHFRCARGSKWTDDARRRDVTGDFGRGVPAQSFNAGSDNVEGIASRERRPMETIMTEQGPITLPYGGSTRGFMPTVAELLVAPYNDSRFMAISDRYYR